MAAPAGFSEVDIQRLAGSRSFGRGVEYVDSVANLEISDARITATVHGTHRYQVTLTAEGQLDGTCTCPHGLEGNFCKHCVATAMAVLRLGDDLSGHVKATKARETSLRSWLEALSKEELLAELLGIITDDPDLRRRFELRAAAEHADGATIRRAVRELITVTGYIEYDQVWDYARGVEDAADAIDSLIDADGAAEAIGIAREAIALLAGAFETVDDSSGNVGDSAYQLLGVHLRACQAAPPDPESLADYLAGLLLNNDYGIAPDLGDYADLLGDAGLSRVRQRITSAYAANPRDYYARHLMETTFKAERDVDALVAMYSTELDDRGWMHLRIARELDQAGRHDDALSWAERGLREAHRADDRLVDYLADRYASDGRTEDAFALRKSRFEAERSLANYQKLRHASTEAGTWRTERPKALAQLRKDADATPARTQLNWGWAGPVLVEALIDDGDLDAAWTAVTTGPAKAAATYDQQIRLADSLASTRPADVLPVYHAAIDSLRYQTGDQIYRQMAGMLISARDCHEKLGTTPEFRRYLAALRTDQKRKRNLMKILDQNGL